MTLSPAVPVSAAAAHVADISGLGPVRVVLGLANQILDAANNVRANTALARAIARRVGEISDVLTTALDDSASSPMEQSVKEALGSLRRTLEELNESISTSGRRSYLSQILHQQRDKDRLIGLTTSVENAFDLLVVKMRIQSSLMASTLASEIDRIATHHIEQLPPIPELAPASVSRLPPRPHLHFGRAAESQAVVDIAVADAPGRAVILGGPGMGKTTLALAVLYDPSVAQKFGVRRFFVACDAAESQSSCLVTIADAFGIVAANQTALRKKLVDAIGTEPALLVLDNFESAWEAASQRSGAEDVLRLLDAVPNLALLLTMRGTERPVGVSWSRPFLPPMTPLGDAAARQTFLSIAAVPESDPAIGTLMAHLDCIPLAVVLVANLAQFETPGILLQRWTELRTAILRRGSGQQRLTNLEVSIELSLRSPRMLACPEAQDLLAVLALLPHGAVDTDIQQWDGVSSRQALATLLRTALASRRADDRIYVLAPVREFVLAQYPLSSATAPVFRHYFALAELAYHSIKFTFDAEAIAAVAPELGNIDAVVRHCLRGDAEVQRAAITASTRLCALFSETSMGTGPELLPVALAAARDGGHDDLRGDLIFEWGKLSFNGSLSGDPQTLYREARDAYELSGNAGGVLDTDITLTQFLPPADAAVAAHRLFVVADADRDMWRAAKCAWMCARAHERGGRPRDAITQHRLAISTAQQAESTSGVQRLVGICQYGIAECLRFLADFSGAQVAYGAALEIFDALHFPNGSIVVTSQLANALKLQGKPVEAIECATRGLAIPGAASFRSYKDCLLTIVDANAQIANWEASAAALSRLNQLVERAPLSTSEQTLLLSTRASVASARGDTEEARALAQAALRLSRSRDHVKSKEEMLHKEANMLLLLANIEYESNQLEEAALLSVTAAIHFLAVMDTTWVRIRSG
ncbi:hypothetical protein AURDEDRAFT_163368 [Auricularia subglabra TFB-10046 SS5]|nr:hypothetical protein AURDEDRAFT_163368 [Auricularia subglabra TFB-10046 SS5]